MKITEQAYSYAFDLIVFFLSLHRKLYFFILPVNCSFTRFGRKLKAIFQMCSNRNGGKMLIWNTSAPAAGWLDSAYELQSQTKSIDTPLGNCTIKKQCATVQTKEYTFVKSSSNVASIWSCNNYPINK